MADKRAEFVAFGKIPRLFRDCTITEKIDGTNAQIVVPEDPTAPLLAGSRNRWLSESHDNYGFWRWVQENTDQLRMLGPGRFYGEWWGAGIQRRYNQTTKRFSLFNPDALRNLTQANPPGLTIQPEIVGVVPVLYQGPFDSNAVRLVLEKLRREGSMAAPGFMNPEGIIVFHHSAGRMFKVTLDGDNHKEAEAA